MGVADDRTLLLGTHRGHEPSARALWERHAPAMLALAGAIVAARGAAAPEDVVQRVFCRVLEADRRRLREVRDVRAWLCQATRRVALNELRAHRRERARRAAGARAERHVESAGADDELSAAIDALPRRLREVVVLKHAGGLTFDQMALALDANRSTCASRYRVAIERLRERLGRLEAAREEVTHG